MRQRRTSQSAPARIPGPPVTVWLLLAAILTGGLLGIAAIAGAKPDRAGTLDAVPVLGESIERTLQRPVVAGLLAALVTVLLAAAVRGGRLRWLAHRATWIDVGVFAAPSTLPKKEARQLSLRFRERLCDLHLAAPGPQPGAAPRSDFLQLIGSAAQSNAVLSLAAGMLRAAWPGHAYVVEGALMQRDEPEPFGVSVQVVMSASITSRPMVCWAASWDDAVDNAANQAAAFILPRTRWARNAPWTAWKGTTLPPALVDAYERGSARAAERRYDEALCDFYAALVLDPKNIDVRLRIGFLQEKLGMPLDALATYQAVDGLGKLVAPRTVLRGAVPTRSGRLRRRTLNIARYRHAVILGAGTDLVKEWCTAQSDPPNRRDYERSALRDFLAPALLARCEEKVNTTQASNSPALEEAAAWRRRVRARASGPRA